MDFGSCIRNAVGSVHATTPSGVELDINDKHDNDFVRLDHMIVEQNADSAVVRLRLCNIGDAPLQIGRVAVIDVSNKWQGRLELGGRMTAWSFLWSILRHRSMADLCTEWFEHEKRHFSSRYYAVVGNRSAERFLTVGFLGFAGHDTHIDLKAADPFKFESFKAVADFGNRPLAPGETLTTEPVYVNWGASPREALREYAERLAQGMGGEPCRKNVIGWSTWDYFHADITEDDVIRHADWLAERRGQIPVDVIQIDHGFEVREGEWLKTNERFPHGLEWLSDSLVSRGFRPGLWLCPFLVAPDSRVAREHPDWVIRDPAGKPLELNGYAVKCVYGLDCSIPEAREWVTKLAKEVTGDYGFAYVKLDGANAQVLSPLGRLADAGMSAAEALQRGLAAFREGMQEGSFLLNAGMFGLSIGLVDGMRIGPDVGARWDDSMIDRHHGERDNYRGSGLILRCIAASANAHMFHKRLWINDPDYLIVRQKGSRSELTCEEAISWASVVALSDGLVMLGDDLTELDEQRLEILDKVLPHYGRAAVPLDFFERPVPCMLDLTVDKPSAGWHVLCVTNTQIPKRERDLDVEFAKLGLDSYKPYAVFDFWQSRYLGEFETRLPVRNLPPHHSRVFGIRELADVPQVVGTDMHISQGGVEFEDVGWVEAEQTLRMETRDCGKQGFVFIRVPDGFSPGNGLEHAEGCIYRARISANGDVRSVRCAP